jgi:hypothetical protein
VEILWRAPASDKDSSPNCKRDLGSLSQVFVCSKAHKHDRAGMSIIYLKSSVRYSVSWRGLSWTRTDSYFLSVWVVTLGANECLFNRIHCDQIIWVQVLVWRQRSELAIDEPTSMQIGLDQQRRSSGLSHERTIGQMKRRVTADMATYDVDLEQGSIVAHDAIASLTCHQHEYHHRHQ